MKKVKKPFFAQFLENQIADEKLTNTKGGLSAATFATATAASDKKKKIKIEQTMKYPSDADEDYTMKYPSDSDEW
ncbi:microviridin/marinostatin family tricyclic proteinase inhibitor [uncultured Microscilla sp.]|uniref:microviridin/marinostatin family tricyclic proteinase inhibitor n=1 Tax=uncultured Microscilla sp. TaxID=432653 RepID=UPI0026210A9E|nr:microviridin/marinostatin family tricyclic proteinase inhibitor [uncultured Microscilla sp.]